MLNISIVLYIPQWTRVHSLVQTLLKAETVKNIYLIDNSPTEAEDSEQKSLSGSRKTHYLWNEGKNIGFGRAHNIALRESIWQRTKYHVVIDENIDVKAEDIDRLHYFMEHNPQVGQLMPKMLSPKGEILPLLRLLPTPIEVCKNYFFPVFIEKKRVSDTDLFTAENEQIMNVPVLSHCFMFLRTEAALKARLFDERYVSPIAHIDLTRTIHRDYLTLYVPDITAVYEENEMKYKGLSSYQRAADWCRYFHKWGWILDSERKEINQLTLQLCKTEQQ